MEPLTVPYKVLTGYYRIPYYTGYLESTRDGLFMVLKVAYSSTSKGVEYYGIQGLLGHR
jgi:hypothetical protein